MTTRFSLTSSPYVLFIAADCCCTGLALCFQLDATVPTNSPTKNVPAQQRVRVSWSIPNERETDWLRVYQPWLRPR